MSARVSVREVRTALLSRRELALIDLRSEAEFATGHPLFAAQIPLDRLELEAPLRIPRRATPVVLYGADDSAARGREILLALGYSQVALLEGGLEAWRSAASSCFRTSTPTARRSVSSSSIAAARRPFRQKKSGSADRAGQRHRDRGCAPLRGVQTMSIPTGTSVPAPSSCCGYPPWRPIRARP